MDPLRREETDYTPAVTLDKHAGVFEIVGRSLPLDASVWYQPLIDWLVTYADNPNATTVFSFRLDSFNTASSKAILDLLYALEKVPGARVNWYFQDEDEDMEEAGEEFSELVDIPFTFAALD